MDTPVDLTIKPGVERWSYKTGTDPQAKDIDIRKPLTETAITDLIMLQSPADPDALTARDEPTEMTGFQVSATLTGYKEEQDGDYHLVLDDGQGHTMIAEIPDPNFCAGSVWLNLIASSRQTFDAKFGKMLAALRVMKVEMTDVGGEAAGVPMITKVSIPVKVFGVGFFDRLHGQTGVAPNGIEIHPVLEIDFT